MNIETVRICEAVVYGYQQGEDAAQVQHLKREKSLRVELSELKAENQALRDERANLVRMNDELTNNEWGRVHDVLDTVAKKCNWDVDKLYALAESIKEVQAKPYRAEGTIHNDAAPMTDEKQVGR